MSTTDLDAFGGMISTAVLLLVTPWPSADFWLTLLALLGLIGMQTIDWFRTHPVHKSWLQDEQLSGVSAGFFAFGTQTKTIRPVSWSTVRDRWEYSHVARAALAFGSFVALVIRNACPS